MSLAKNAEEPTKHSRGLERTKALMSTGDRAKWHDRWACRRKSAVFNRTTLGEQKRCAGAVQREYKALMKGQTTPSWSERMSQSPPTPGMKHSHAPTRAFTHEHTERHPRNHFTQLTSVHRGPILDFSCKAYLIAAASSHRTQLLISFLPPSLVFDFLSLFAVPGVLSVVKSSRMAQWLLSVVQIMRMLFFLF